MKIWKVVELRVSVFKYFHNHMKIVSTGQIHLDASCYCCEIKCEAAIYLCKNSYRHCAERWRAGMNTIAPYTIVIQSNRNENMDNYHQKLLFNINNMWSRFAQLYFFKIFSILLNSIRVSMLISSLKANKRTYSSPFLNHFF